MSDLISILRLQCTTPRPYCQNMVVLTLNLGVLRMSSWLKKKYQLKHLQSDKYTEKGCIGYISSLLSSVYQDARIHCIPCPGFNSSKMRMKLYLAPAFFERSFVSLRRVVSVPLFLWKPYCLTGLPEAVIKLSVNIEIEASLVEKRLDTGCLEIVSDIARRKGGVHSRAYRANTSQTSDKY